MPRSILLPFVWALPAVILALVSASAAEPVKVPLWNGQAPNGDGAFEQAEAYIYLHAPEKPNGAAVVICPGGGYGGQVLDHEGHFIAQWLNKHGVAGVVLQYRLPRGRAAVPLLDAQQALRLVRSKAQAWAIDPAKVGIMGFSAGGHLAATAGTHFDHGAKAATEIGTYSCRPDFLLLIYPVITMGAQGHGGSRKNLLGDNPTPELLKLYSNEQQVTQETPPTFLAHARDDRPVPPENSKLFYEACLAHKVPARYLELPSGGHGLNGYKGPMWEAWQRGALEFLVEQKFLPAAGR